MTDAKPLTLLDLTTWLREHGVKSIELAATFGGYSFEVTGGRFVALQSIELFDTIPAPPPEDLSLPPTEHAELKSDSQCVATGCAEQGGWYGTRFCRAHGFAAAGVK